MNTDNYTKTNLSIYERYDNNEALIFREFIPHVIIIERLNYPLWATIGIPGSLLNILIWISRPMRRGGSTAAAIYQASLGIVDFGFLITYIVWYLHVIWTLGALDFTILCELYPIMTYLFQYASPTFAFIFTLERYLAICHPFQSQRLFLRSTLKNAIISTIIIFSLCFCTASVQGLFFTFENGTCNFRSTLEDQTTIASTLYTNWIFFTELLFFFCLPMTCLCLNFFVIRVLHGTSKTKQQTSSIKQTASNSIVINFESSISKGVRSSTVTLLCTSFYLLIAHLSVAITMLIHKLLPTRNIYLSDSEIRKDPDWLYYFHYFTARVSIEFFSMSHYAIKFFIYLATSQQFREQCYRLLLLPCLQRMKCLKTTYFRANMSKSFHLSNKFNSIESTSMTDGHSDFKFVQNKYLTIKKPLIMRPPLGLSRTVLAANGERIQITNSSLA